MADKTSHRCASCSEIYINGCQLEVSIMRSRIWLQGSYGPWKSWKTLENFWSPGNPWKPWKSPGIFFMKPWKISQNIIEKINSSNGAFSGLNNKHLKSLAIWASDCQDLLAQIQRVLAWPEIERSQFKFWWLCFYGYSPLLNMNKYVYVKCCFSIVISCRCMSLLQYVILLFSYAKWFQFRKVFLSDLFSLAKTL